MIRKKEQTYLKKKYIQRRGKLCWANNMQIEKRANTKKLHNLWWKTEEYRIKLGLTVHGMFAKEKRIVNTQNDSSFCDTLNAFQEDLYLTLE